MKILASKTALYLLCTYACVATICLTTFGENADAPWKPKIVTIGGPSVLSTSIFDSFLNNGVPAAFAGPGSNNSSIPVLALENNSSVAQEIFKTFLKEEEKIMESPAKTNMDYMASNKGSMENANGLSSQHT